MSMNVLDDCSRSVAVQLSSNYHLENTLKMSLSLKTNKQACCFLNIRHYFLIVFICGEYRSRTDDLLRARQAL